MIHFLCNIQNNTNTNTNKVLRWFNIVEEARRGNPVEGFTERGVREYKGYCKFRVLKNRCLFVTKETSRTKPSPPKRPWDVSGYNIDL